MGIKKVLICICLVFLAGCQSTTKNKTLYEGLDGKETYQKVIDAYNQNVTYYQSKQVDSNSTIIKEYYKGDKQTSVVTKMLFDDADGQSLLYNIYEANNYHTLFANGETYEYECMDDYSGSRKDLYSDYNSDQTQIINVDRKDEGETIHLSVKTKEIVTYQADDEGEERYALHQLVVDQNGYITNETISYYTDDSFQTTSQEDTTIENSGFNQKDTKDLEKEIELMKSCDGLEYDKVMEKVSL